MFQQNHNMFHAFLKPKRFITKCKVSNVPEPSVGLGISLRSAWPWKFPFSNEFIFSSWALVYSCKCNMQCLPAKVKAGTGPFAGWPDYKGIYRHPQVCTGLKAWHSVWEKNRRGSGTHMMQCQQFTTLPTSKFILIVHLRLDPNSTLLFELASC